MQALGELQNKINKVSNQINDLENGTNGLSITESTNCYQDTDADDAGIDADDNKNLALDQDPYPPGPWDFDINHHVKAQLFGDGEITEIFPPLFDGKYVLTMEARRAFRAFMDLSYTELVLEGYKPTTIYQKVVDKEYYVYQRKSPEFTKTETRYFISTCPHPDLELLYNCFYTERIGRDHKKKLPSTSLLQYLLDGYTFACMYMLIGIEWPHIAAPITIGLDLRQFTKKEVAQVQEVLKRRHEIGIDKKETRIVKAVDGKYILIFEGMGAFRFTALIAPYMPVELNFKLSDNLFGLKEEINLGPALLKCSLKRIHNC